MILKLRRGKGKQQIRGGESVCVSAKCSLLPQEKEKSRRVGERTPG